MSDRVLAGVMPVTFYDPTNMSPICLVNALTDEGLNKIQYIEDWFMRKDKLLDVTRIGINSLFISTDIKKGLDFRLK